MAISDYDLLYFLSDGTWWNFRKKISNSISVLVSISTKQVKPEVVIKQLLSNASGSFFTLGKDK